ncbi:PA4642 family protein [Halioxenophilus sp. WMMB6]|uniref:PA4642 family protein n=1 Tax=Halioxenophilus sp. WMMB6 TaxID=3073815 RepID=UPI00295EC27E|nr:PA4642 family protein [Halioxenophilus sp. WMMB6]
MALKKDKQKVLGEVFDDARVKSFLNFQPPEGVNGDFHVLEKAYRGMNIDNFATFIEFFLAEGRDLNAPGPDGRNLLQQIRSHRLGVDYAQLLAEKGAE